jgi:hypothetical protein
MSDEVSKYPAMLFKEGGDVVIDGKGYDTHIVESADDEADAVKAGWARYKAPARKKAGE